MSSQKQSSNKEEFIRVLKLLLENHGLRYDEVAQETGISTQILKNANNYTPGSTKGFAATTMRINALKALLHRLENPEEDQRRRETVEERLKTVEAELAELRKMVAENVTNSEPVVVEKKGKKKDQMLVKRKNTD